MVSVWLSKLHLEVISALKKNNEMLYTPFIKQNVQVYQHQLQLYN